MLLSMILVFMLMLIGSNYSAAALDYNSNISGSIEILAISDGVRLNGVTFDAWRVGDITDGDLLLQSKYSKYNLNISSVNFPATLRECLIRDSIRPDLKAISNQDGVAVFDNLSSGAYLICSEDFEQGRYKYSGVSMLVYLPYLDSNNNLSMNAVLEAKFERRKLPDPERPSQDTITRKALKVWEDDDNNSGRRPDEIRVELLRDGRSWDVKILSESNNWRHTWTDLDPAYKWTVIELDVSSDYELDIEKHGRTYVLTNRLISTPDPEYPEPGPGPGPELNPGPTEPNPGPGPVTPGPGRPSVPSPGDPNVPGSPGPKIPQTGNPVWLISLFTGLGLLFICLSVVFRKKTRVSMAFVIPGVFLIAIAFVCMLFFQIESEFGGRDMPDISPYIEYYNETQDPADPEAAVPDYVLNPDEAMLVVSIDSYDYAGQLEIPDQDLVLSVLSELTYPGLKISPARYSGNIYNNNLIIGAHNYDRHFGRLKYLSAGDEIIFTDMAGNVFYYTVTTVDTLGPYESDKLVSENPGLTLFTCTYGGQSRVVVRCELDTTRMPDWSVLFDIEAL